ncbi:hypothetical protein C0992_009920 [Termitomyces sp. T32_za158]|nr:hypothetical protein C0992_009920 [Termitomyces sp. T32_za158]
MPEAVSLPQLRKIPFSALAKLGGVGPKIRTDGDVLAWKTKQSYQDYALFLRRLNESVVGQFLPWTSSSSQAITRTLELLDTLDLWIDEIPPLQSPQRFGNLAFRTWGARLEEVGQR